MGERLKGKSAVVTGGGRGIGRGIALGLAAEGASVVVNDLGCTGEGRGADPGPADEVVQEIKNGGGQAVANYDTVTDFGSAERLIKSCVDNFGKIDILVNNAGIWRYGTIFDMSEEDWDATVAVHLKGTFNTCRHAAPLMRDQRSGRIINISSEGRRAVTTFTLGYSEAKAGIVGLTRLITRELIARGLGDRVTCNAIEPQAVTRLAVLLAERGITIQQMYDDGCISKARLEQFSQLPAPGPEFVSPIVVYLATDEAANINGRVFRTGAGWVALISDPVEARAIYKDPKTEGPWTLDELTRIMPLSLEMDMVTPVARKPRT